jgi:hypothetical protein
MKKSKIKEMPKKPVVSAVGVAFRLQQPSFKPTGKEGIWKYGQ